MEKNVEEAGLVGQIGCFVWDMVWDLLILRYLLDI